MRGQAGACFPLLKRFKITVMCSAPTCAHPENLGGRSSLTGAQPGQGPYLAGREMGQAVITEALTGHMVSVRMQ